MRLCWVVENVDSSEEDEESSSSSSFRWKTFEVGVVGVERRPEARRGSAPSGAKAPGPFSSEKEEEYERRCPGLLPIVAVVVVVEGPEYGIACMSLLLLLPLIMSVCVALGQ